MDNPKIKFFGGVGTATGANIALYLGDKKILIDCGLYQGDRQAFSKNAEPFPYNPRDFDFLFITHAHMDHIGRVPKLVKDGFRGKIISTLETLEISRPMFEDALKIMLSKDPETALYRQEDIDESLSLWQGFDYHREEEIDGGAKFTLTDAGHILGSAIVTISYGGKKISFTGDLGNSPSPLLPDTEFITDSNYIVMESVYGDRNHEEKNERREKLKKYILNGIEKKGAIIIPTFSIERTQVILYELNNMVEDGEIPSIPVFVDSPLASKVTAIYAKHAGRFKEEVREEIKRGDNIFNFPKLSITHSRFESEALEKTPNPKIILAGSGMSEGGRVVNHEIEHLPDPKATIILAGYQAAGALGRLLEEGVGKVEINGEMVKVRAKIEKISGYSSHKDSDHLIEFVEKAGESGKLKKVFCIMGEPKSSIFLVQRIREYLGLDAIYPEARKEYLL